MTLLPKLSRKTSRKTQALVITLLVSLSFTFISFFSANPAGVDAQSSASIWQQINQLQSQMAQLNASIQQKESKVSSLNGNIQNNESTIGQLQNIISEKEQLIQDKQSQIDLLTQSINDEKSQIDALNAQITKLYGVFVQRAKVSYENSFVNPFLITLGNSSIQDVFSNLEYFANTRKQDSTLLSEMENNQFMLNQKLNDLTVQETDLANAQSELLSEKNSLESQQQSLQAQNFSYQSQKNQLASQINLNQQELARIAQQAQSLKDAVVGSGVGPVYGAPGWDYYYYNQEDPRWKSQCLGVTQYYCSYGYTIGQIGCLVTDVAMIMTYYGKVTTPGQLAANTNNFYGVLWSWSAPIGLSLSWLGNMSDVDYQLSIGHPVIAELNLGYSPHWIMFIHKQGNDYVINDPYRGGGIMFSSYYSRGQLTGNYILYTP